MSALRVTTLALAALIVAGCGRKTTDAAPLVDAAPAPTDAGAADASDGASSEAPRAALAPLPLPATPRDLRAPPKGATKTARGVAVLVLDKGTSDERPTLEDKVVAHYVGWTKDGKVFDSSYRRGEPSTFAVSGVIPGWSEALTVMHAGERARVWIPAKLAYGEKTSPGIPQGDLVMEITLLEIKRAP